jgi:hypothetical protein
MRVACTAVAAADHQQIDFLTEGGQLVYGDAIDRTAIDAIEFRQALARLTQQLIHADAQLESSIKSCTRSVDSARWADHLHDANASPVGSRQLAANGKRLGAAAGAVVANADRGDQRRRCAVGVDVGI